MLEYLSHRYKSFARPSEVRRRLSTKGEDEKETRNILSTMLCYFHSLSHPMYKRNPLPTTELLDTLRMLRKRNESNLPLTIGNYTMG